jgi:hypothetical protein
VSDHPAPPVVTKPYPTRDPQRAEGSTRGRPRGGPHARPERYVLPQHRKRGHEVYNPALRGTFKGPSGQKRLRTLQADASRRANPIVEKIMNDYLMNHGDNANPENKPVVDSRAKSAVRALVEIVETRDENGVPLHDAKVRVQSAVALLNWFLEKPVTKTETTLTTAEDWLASLDTDKSY